MLRWAIFLFVAACLPIGEPNDVDTDDGEVGSEKKTSTFRVVTWNIESVGSTGSTQFQAAQSILQRLDADIVGINEVDDIDKSYLEQLAENLHYNYVLIPSSNPFGSLRNALLSRFEFVDSKIHTSAALSSDNDANDLTRLPVSAVLDLPNTDKNLAVVVQHWKSGFDDSDEFRRAIDGQRTAQAALTWNAELAIVMGDVNAQVDDMPDSPSNFGAIPSGTPYSYWLGADLYSLLDSSGVPNSPFAPFLDAGFVTVEASQLDGRTGTRESGRRIDYLMVNPALAAATIDAEVYDSRDESFGGLEKWGEPLERATSAEASDHYPVFADFTFEL
ncbi:MAG: hypothetical protein HN348_26260 [Proteobacteria bacterium]|nr:hypothetical protein [Pseudomonadota bacterium]